MAIKLAAAFEPRTVDLGYGVTVTLGPIGFADLKAAEGAALRKARTQIEARREATEIAAEGSDAVAALGDDIVALAEEIMLDEMVGRHAVAWAGVLDDDGETPAALTRDNWVRFRRGVPFLADRLRAEIRMPMELVVREGKPSTP